MARKGGRAIGVANSACFQPGTQRKPAMRTATDFNLYYAAPDPWHISHARFRDKVLRRCLKPFIRNKSVLELGCGEGHLTQTIFSKARSVVGIDISDVAIARAKSLNLPNARFECADFLQASFEDYDVIAALECVYSICPFKSRERSWRKLPKNTLTKYFCSRVQLWTTDGTSVISD